MLPHSSTPARFPDLLPHQGARRADRDFCGLSRELRALVIEMVLATDMSCHFQQVKTMKTALQQLERWGGVEWGGRAEPAG